VRYVCVCVCVYVCGVTVNDMLCKLCVYVYMRACACVRMDVCEYVCV